MGYLPIDERDARLKRVRDAMVTKETRCYSCLLRRAECREWLVPDRLVPPV